MWCRWGTSGLPHHVLRCALQGWVFSSIVATFLIFVATSPDGQPRRAFLQPLIYFRETLGGTMAMAVLLLLLLFLPGSLPKSAIVGIRGGPRTYPQCRGRTGRDVTSPQLGG